jgi:PAS domain S-box-containing protein
MLRFNAGLLDRLAEAVIFTDAELRILSWNQAAARLYGWGAPEAVGCPLHDLLQTELVDTTWPEFDDHLRRDDAWSGELVNRHRDGRALTLAASVALVRDAAGNVVGGVGIHRDVTAERASERALRASEAFNRSLRRALPDPLFGIDAQGNVCTLSIPDSLSGQLPPPFILDPSSHPPGAVPPAVEPSVLAEAQKHLEAARTTGIPQSFEYSLPHQGRTHHFETRS